MLVVTLFCSFSWHLYKVSRTEMLCSEHKNRQLRAPVFIVLHLQLDIVVFFLEPLACRI